MKPKHTQTISKGNQRGKYCSVVGSSGKVVTVLTTAENFSG
jgi:hypothetical protein